MKTNLPFLKNSNILKTGNMSLSIRLFAFLSILVASMVLAVIFVLLISGRISRDYSAPQRFAEDEFAKHFQKTTDNLGETTVQLIFLSQSLSRSIEFQLAEKRIPASLLAEYPEVLAEIIGNEINRLQLVLERTSASGVFMILDATVNPGLEGSEHSKAGLYLRRYEPQVPGSPDVEYFYYRGFPQIAYQNNLLMRATWDMEFNVKDRSYFHVPVNKSKEADLPLSKLIFWSMESVIPELNEPTLICCIPLIDSRGSTFGAAGFEISSWNFNVNYSPDNSEYKNTICLFGELNGNALNIPNAMVSGSPPAINRIRGGGKDSFTVFTAGDLNTYESYNGIVYMGLHEKVKMYGADSPFDHNFIMSILVSKDEIDAAKRIVNIRIAYICVTLLIVGIGVSYFISRRYLKPITSALNNIKSGDIEKTDKTRIAEIDGILDYISKLIEERKPEQVQVVSKADNLKAASLEKLSFQELRIADLTLRGFSYTEIADTLELKPNTVKWYLKVLYSKLGISSKRELFDLAVTRDSN